MNVAPNRVVVIGGGTGVFTVLSGLRNYPHRLSAVVSMADDGGSTGVLREEFGILPPGDIRRALVALTRTDDKILSDLFNYRFREGYGLEGHNFGNLFLTALQRLTGDFRRAVKEAARILGATGEVIPVTLERTKLYAELEDGQIIKGETNIDIPKHDGRLRIRKVWLKPKPKANSEALRAIRGASVIVIGPGDLYTSIIPNILVSGIPEAIRESPAKKIYFCNMMTKFGETYNFRASDFLNVLETYLGKRSLDYFVFNSERPPRSRLKPYIREHADLVELDEDEFTKGGPSPRRSGFGHAGGPALIKAPLLRRGLLIRHDPKKLARLISLLL